MKAEKDKRLREIVKMIETKIYLLNVGVTPLFYTIFEFKKQLHKREGGLDK